MKVFVKTKTENNTSQGAGRRAVADITIVPFSCNCLNKEALRASYRHAVGGAASSLPELPVVLEEWTACVLPERCTKLHPDSDPSNPALHSQFVQLNEAYRVLSKEPSRREYDFKIRHPYGGGGGQAFRSASSHGNSSTAAQDNMRYWEQVYQSHTQEMSAEEREQQRRRNFRLMGYCLLTMALSVGVHFIFFRKLEEVHTNYMDEKDRVIAEIYKESKERARVNGFKKQTEILRQKHAEFVEKYKMGSGGEK
ncbi:dnaJ homolog subfamily C member 4 isoform X7 [Dunckerocampus dactyliophorus]|uniref:dnaJ homolog subfamily C member 4 isoform X7 n=1 Tax=Dunckerocampus dactyliophorus TaxID=161453 RepID=UPI0024061297|nr:dnaJ homolog subfamily C member 4 isoform X7 [Dunckerocampus dactyliophorus]